MKLFIHLLNKISNKIKQPNNILNLELSYSLVNNDYYYIDHYLKCHLTQINSYFINDANDNKLLRSASKNNNIKLVNFLLKYGFNNNFGCEYALCNSAHNGNFKIVKILIKNGVNVHFRDNEALLNSICRNHFRIAKFLIQNDANPKDEYLLNICFQNNYPKMINLLLKNITNFNEVKNDCLQSASKYGHLRLVKFLLKNKADINNSSALHSASLNGKIEIVDYLLQNNADANNSSLEILSEGGNFEMIELLLKHKANVQDKNDYALIKAYEYNDLEIVKLLLQYKADIHYDYCLKQSYRDMNFKMVEILLKYGKQP